MGFRVINPQRIKKLKIHPEFVQTSSKTLDSNCQLFYNESAGSSEELMAPRRVTGSFLVKLTV
jgi:hypothetical protein